MPRTGENRPAYHRTGIVLGVVVVAALAIVWPLDLLSSQKSVVIASQASSHTLHCAPHPGKPIPTSCPTVVKHSATLVPCTKNDLLPSGKSLSGAYQGYATASIQLMNTTDTSCFLAGAPLLKVTSSSGMVVPVSKGQFGSQQVDLQPGEELFMLIGSPGGCADTGTLGRASSATLTVPGGTITIPGIDFGMGCGAPTVVLYEAQEPEPAPTHLPPASPAPLLKQGTSVPNVPPPTHH